MFAVSFPYVGQAHCVVPRRRLHLLPMPLCVWSVPSRLGITMPMSLANTESLSRCRKLRELLLCALPQQILSKGGLDQVIVPGAPLHCLCFDQISSQGSADVGTV